MSDESCNCGCSTKPETETTEECNCGCGSSSEAEPKEESVA
jgi:hypothetical protein